jgi:hypothetical protein
MSSLGPFAFLLPPGQKEPVSQGWQVLALAPVLGMKVPGGQTASSRSSRERNRDHQIIISNRII